MADEKDMTDVLEKLAAIISKQRSDTALDVLIAEMKKDVGRLQEENRELKDTVYKQHEPVVTWTRNFMDSYRKVMTIVITSGVITVIGLLIQLYSYNKK